MNLGSLKETLMRDKQYNKIPTIFLSPLETYGLMVHFLLEKNKKRYFIRFIDYLIRKVKPIREKVVGLCIDEQEELYLFFKKPLEFITHLIANPLRRVLLMGNLLKRGLDRAVNKITNPLISKKELVNVKISYKPVHIPKKAGGYRTLLIPNEKLKGIQRKILQLFYQMHISFPYAHGFYPGRSAYTNAMVHKGAIKVLKIDIKNAFDSININKALKPQLVKFLGKDGAEFVLKYCIHQNKLPQGAPTSGYLLNFALSRFDAYIAEIALRCGLRYSRFADDICISATEKHINSINVKKILELIECRLMQYGMALNRDKICIRRHPKRISVTGYVLNSGEPTISRKKRRIYRAMLYNHMTGKNSLSREKITGIIGWIKTANPKYAQKLLQITTNSDNLV